MTGLRIEVSDGVRRRIGKWFAGISVGLSLYGVVVLGVLWGWSALVRTDAVYFGVLGLGFGALTWLLIRAQPDNGAVWAGAWSALFSSLFAAGLATAVLLSRGAFPGLTLDELRELSPAMLPRPAAFALHFRFWAVVPALWLPLTFGLLLFPDGRPPGPGWRWIGWLSIVAITVATVASAVVHNPWSPRPVMAAEDSVDSFGGALIDLAFLVSSLTAVVCAASLVVRYRRAAGTTRGQIRWVGFGGAVFISALLAGESLDDTIGGVAGDLVGIGAFALLIACWGVAVTRYRLYEIDVVISKSVTYLGLAAAIAALYAAVAIAPLLVIGQWDDGGPGLVLPIVAAAVVALVFEPIRSRTQRWANRLVYGDRASPYEVLSRVTSSLSDTTAGDGTDDLAHLLSQGTGAELAVVWLRQNDVFHPAGVCAADRMAVIEPVPIDGLVDDEFTESRTVHHRDEQIGALSITKPRNDQITPADRELLTDVAAGAGLLLRNIGLNRELETRAAEVRASRRRLLAAQDAERHRLERDLHDGAQQQVVALKVKLGIARTIAEREGADEIATRVIALAEETQHAVDALRAVAHGIYPPLLESEGLESALRAVERSSSMPLVIETSGLSRYPRPIEETTYFCVLDLVERARMTGASGAHIDVAGRNGDLVVEFDVTDSINTDGADEVDLTAVFDRVDAAGGTLRVEDQPDRGRLITTSFPVVDLEVAP